MKPEVEEELVDSSRRLELRKSRGGNSKPEVEEVVPFWLSEETGAEDDADDVEDELAEVFGLITAVSPITSSGSLSGVE